MTSAVAEDERVYLDVPMAAFQDTAHSVVPWKNIYLHVKWSSNVNDLIESGRIAINTRNIIFDKERYEKLTTGDLMPSSQEKQLIIQSHEQVEYGHENSSSVPMELRGPCKDIWFGLKANEDFSAHTTDISTTSLYMSTPYANVYPQPHQSSGVVRLTETSTGPTITSANIRVNDDQLFEVQGEKFFNQVIPYYRYKGCPAPGFYYYSFAIHPQQFQPSGSFNFSSTTNKYLNLTNEPYESDVHIISNRYNIAERNVPLFLD